MTPTTPQVVEELNIDSDDGSESDDMEVGAEAWDMKVPDEKAQKEKAQDDDMDADSGVEDNDAADGVGATEVQDDANKNRHFQTNIKPRDANRTAKTLSRRRSSGSREAQGETPKVKRSVTMETSEEEQDESGIVMDAEPDESQC